MYDNLKYKPNNIYVPPTFHEVCILISAKNAHVINLLLNPNTQDVDYHCTQQVSVVGGPFSIAMPLARVFHAPSLPCLHRICSLEWG
jgi:hypothetical protein